MITKLGGVLSFFSIFCASFFAGCGTNTVTTYASSANFEYSSLNAVVGQVIELSQNTLLTVPQNLQGTAIFSSSNTSVAEINVLTGQIVCKKEGQTTIFGYIKSSKTDFVGDSFLLSVSKAPVYATGFTLQTENKIFVGMTDENTKNELQLFGQNVTVMPTVSYSSLNIVSYDFTSGKITPLAVGEVVVYVSLQLQNGSTLTKQFTVEVVQQIMYIETQDTYYVNRGAYLPVAYSVKDNTKQLGYADNQSVIVEILISNNPITLITNDFMALLFQAGNTAGSAIIKLTSVSHPSVYKTFIVYIQ